MASSDIEERQRLYEEIKGSHDRLAEHLIDFAKVSRSQAEKDFYSAWTLAVELMGDFRARSAIPYLISEITTKTPRLSGRSSVSSFPCAEALFRIGFPAVDELIRRSTKPASRTETYALITTLRAILGKEGASWRLESEIMFSDTGGEVRLRGMIEILDDEEKFVSFLEEVKNEFMRLPRDQMPSQPISSIEFHPLLKDIASSDMKVRRRAYEELKEDHDKLIKDLIDFAKTSRPQATEEFHSSWTLAVDLLGDIRTREAVPYLVSEIATSPPTPLLNPDILQSHPCALALVKIGIPSINPIMSRLVQSATKREMAVVAYTIRSIFGEDLALLRLEKELKEGIYDNKERVSELMRMIRDRDYDY